MDPKDRIIVALDVHGLAEAMNLAEKLVNHVGAFKIGLELQTACLTSIMSSDLRLADETLFHLRMLSHNTEIKVFWDGKWDDIPNTVAGAAKGIQPAKVWAFNVHATAGREAMEKAVENKGKSLVFAVTILTSIDETAMNNELGIPGLVANEVARLANLSQSAGVDGIIASPQEIPTIHRVCGPEMLIVTPGVRPAGADVGDQKRVMTPGEAVALGADYLVIGRPITAAPNPVEAAKRIAEEIYLAELKQSIPSGQASPVLCREKVKQ